MKTSLVASTAGVLMSAGLLLSAAPAMAQGRIGVAVSVGLPVVAVAVAPAPIVYAAAPAPVYVAPPVVYGYGPVRVGAPYWRYHHGYRVAYRGWR